MTAVEPVPRRSTSKKRHTKPCKFYQLKQCPLSAEECDFAHVPVPECPPVSPVLRRKSCRYFLSGHCTQGSSCRFRHGPEVTEDDKRLSGNRRPDRPLTKSATMPAYPEAPEYLINDYFSGLEPGSFVPPPPAPLYTLSPGYIPWAPYAIPVTGPGYGYGPNSPEDSPANLISPTATTTSSDSATGICSPSGSSSSMTDEGIVNSVKSLQINPADTSSTTTSPITPVNPVPVRTPTTISPTSYYNEHGHRWPSKSFNRPVRSQSLSSTTSSRHKLNYKTKPCKYYKAGNRCPNGDLCTFLHDSYATAKTPTSPEQAQSPSSDTQQMHHELPVKPVSLQEENKKKGFYPISWRVIGGGVMIGGKTTDHSSPEGGDTSVDADTSRGSREDSGAELEPAHSKSHRRDKGKPSSRNAAPLSVNVSSLPHGQVEGDVVTRRRGRAKSIPPTPTYERVDILTLFSAAESPGGL